CNCGGEYKKGAVKSRLSTLPKLWRRKRNDLRKAQAHMSLKDFSLAREGDSIAENFFPARKIGRYISVFGEEST
ncbi:MAG: hypothetical protein AAGU11_13530, partial [Syntrophobacteraceae bacterium]